MITVLTLWTLTFTRNHKTVAKNKDLPFEMQLLRKIIKIVKMTSYMKHRTGMSITDPRKLDFVTSIDNYEKYKKLSRNILDKLLGIIGMPHIR